MIRYLKNKWDIQSPLQFSVILLVFSVTGTSSLFVKKPAFRLLQIEEATEWWIVAPLYILIVLPSYFLLLLFWGWVFGQYRFFWNFEKKMFSRFFSK